ncbi:hypothetical protein BGZ95_010534 [Linnemannia exigua]|uniref:Uncharacterized protein n=1 Tax=Linnemannia exigua TaxID=604196 RepID=A0AAD4DB95_9FUNG|nr:hypothetical protein BGZ95_010534 [Linnemannia exigua]
MTRASKSYRSTTPKEPKESKVEKQKRLENYRIAKNQAKKFVIPGIIAVIASLFFLFVAMYGFKGTKFDGAGLARGRSATDMIFEQARKNFGGGGQDPEEATREQLKAQIFETFQQGDKKWDQEHPESAMKDYEPIVGAGAGEGTQEEVVME